MSSTMARPTPTSAAAMAITNRANTWPAIVSRKAPKAIRLMFTAFRISSTDMSTSTPFLRASTPYTPVQKRSAPRKRNSLSSTELVPPGDYHGAHEGGEEQDRDGFAGDD